MASLSTAVDLGRVSAISGYAIEASLEGLAPGFLNQRIAIVGEKSSANQTALAKLSATSSKEVGDEYGYDSPLYAAARILRPFSGDVLGGIPTVFYAVDEAGGATPTVITKSITGTASKTVTHFLKLNGRTQLDGQSFSYVVEIGDTATEIAPKMQDALNAVLGVCGVATVDTDNLVFTTGWKGASSAGVNLEIFTDGNDAGLTYAEVSKVDGAGEPSIADALAEFGNEWNTLVVNCVGKSSNILDALEAFNGDANSKNGRYTPTIFKPFVSFFGANDTTLSAISAITDDRKNEMTNVLCPCPGSLGLELEAAANTALVYAPIAQNTPQTDPMKSLYPDMPSDTDTVIGDYADDAKRDQIVKAGASTVLLNSGSYEILDLVTTSHPDDEPQTAVLFRYVRDIVGLDFNMRYKYLILENIYVAGKTIIPDASTSTASDTIKPKRWKSILNTQYAADLEDNALIADKAYFKDSLQVGTGASNPNRFEVTFKAQRTPVARVRSTTNQTQFKFSI